MDINKLRKKLDQIDQDILGLLSTRNKVIEQIKVLKKEKNLPVFDAVREKKLLSRISSISEDIGLNNKFTHELFQLILKESKRVQSNGK